MRRDRSVSQTRFSRRPWTRIRRAAAAVVVGLLAAAIAAGTSAAPAQSSSGDTLLVQIQPAPGEYMFFDPQQAQALVGSVLSATSAYDTQNPLCNGQSPTASFSCVGIGSGVVDTSQACIEFGPWTLYCTPWVTLADDLLSLPTAAGNVDDFTEVGLYGLPSAVGAVAQGLVVPDPVQIGTSAVQGTLTSIGTSNSALLQHFCFASTTAPEWSQPQFLIQPRQYLTIAVSGLTLSSTDTIDLSGLASATYGWVTSVPYHAISTAADCAVAGPSAITSLALNAPYSTEGQPFCGPSTLVPLLKAEVVDTSGSLIMTPTLPTPAASTGCQWTTFAPPSPSGGSPPPTTVPTSTTSTTTTETTPLTTTTSTTQSSASGSSATGSALGTWVAVPWSAPGSGLLPVTRGIHFTIGGSAPSGPVQGTFAYFGDGLVQPTWTGTVQGQASGTTVSLRGEATSGSGSLSLTFSGTITGRTMSGTLNVNGSSQPVELTMPG